MHLVDVMGKFLPAGRIRLHNCHAVLQHIIIDNPQAPSAAVVSMGDNASILWICEPGEGG
jgi:hypothetical protein